MRIEEIMNGDVLTVPPDTPLRKVAALLVAHGFSGLPVCDASGVVVGVVSEADIVLKERGRTEPAGVLARMIDPSHAAEDKKALARTAGEAMTSPPITIAKYRSVAEAARLMVEHDVNRLPVLNAVGDLVGIVSRADLVRAFARPDEEIAREIRESVLRRAMWLEPWTIDIAVKDGEVVLSGIVDRQVDAETVVSLTERIPGVVSVTSDLRHREHNGRAGR
jgi:CBS domain-containing protein